MRNILTFALGIALGTIGTVMANSDKWGTAPELPLQGDSIPIKFIMHPRVDDLIDLGGWEMSDDALESLLGDATTMFTQYNNYLSETETSYSGVRIFAYECYFAPGESTSSGGALYTVADVDNREYDGGSIDEMYVKVVNLSAADCQ